MLPVWVLCAVCVWILAICCRFESFTAAAFGGLQYGGAFVLPATVQCRLHLSTCGVKRKAVGRILVDQNGETRRWFGQGWRTRIWERRFRSTLAVEFSKCVVSRLLKCDGNLLRLELYLESGCGWTLFPNIWKGLVFLQVQFSSRVVGFDNFFTSRLNGFED